ncbi:hypothetical protein ACVI1L_004697 [Bradyrhizobium sp. USDA 4516]
MTEVFAAIPDFRHLRHENRAAAEYLTHLCRDETLSVTYLVADGREGEALQQALAAEGLLPPKTRVIVEAETNAHLYMMFASAGGGYQVTGFVLSDLVFREMPGVCANQIF